VDCEDWGCHSSVEESKILDLMPSDGRVLLLLLVLFTY